MRTIRLAIFASGAGSNAARIIDYFASNANVKVSLVLSNRAKAGVIDVAKNCGISAQVLNKHQFCDFNIIKGLLQDYQVDYIILAGFLMKVPDDLVKLYKDRIINIHPALLPKFGGKGMYGMYVHRAVKLANEKVSGITIHLVNEHYDEGKILFQAQCELTEQDTEDDIRAKVQALEQEFFPVVINKYITSEQ